MCVREVLDFKHTHRHTVLSEYLVSIDVFRYDPWLNSVVRLAKRKCLRCRFASMHFTSVSELKRNMPRFKNGMMIKPSKTKRETRWDANWQLNERGSFSILFITNAASSVCSFVVVKFHVFVNISTYKWYLSIIFYVYTRWCSRVHLITRTYIA